MTSQTARHPTTGEGRKSSEPQMGPTKIFVGVNRIFGWSTAIAGALALAESILRFAFGDFGVAEMAGHALIGSVLLALGIVYIRAPLTREKVAAQNSSAE